MLTPASLQGPRKVCSCRMPFQFCPQCGTKLQPAFKFCPSCGERLPCPHDESLGLSGEDGTSVSTTSLTPKQEPTKGRSQSFYTVFHTYCYIHYIHLCTHMGHKMCLTVSKPGKTPFVSQAKHPLKLHLVLRCEWPASPSAWQRLPSRLSPHPGSPPLPKESRLKVIK